MIGQDVPTLLPALLTDLLFAGAEADAAVKALSDKEILGRKLKCNEAKNVI